MLDIKTSQLTMTAYIKRFLETYCPNHRSTDPVAISQFQLVDTGYLQRTSEDVRLSELKTLGSHQRVSRSGS
jgi:hypothetical protein